MRINVANFSSKLPNKLSIANSTPKGVKMRTVKSVFPTLAAFIVPPWGLVKSYKDGKLSWEAYTRIYYESLSKVDLRGAMKKLCDLVGHDEVSLCCWEGVDEEQCHRKLLYDLLPKDIRGVRE
jgi:uncharacterized protein YeaO (DUF488 family)